VSGGDGRKPYQYGESEWREARPEVGAWVWGEGMYRVWTGHREGTKHTAWWREIQTERAIHPVRSLYIRESSVTRSQNDLGERENQPSKMRRK